MKRVKKAKEPATFDTRCRQRGVAWLKGHPVYDRPYDYWSEFEPDLRTAFHGLCGYCAMLTMKCQMDHFIPVAVLKAKKKDAQAYEWSNFRYAEANLNQKKLSARCLDPYKVQDDWFEIQLPSLQMVLTNSVPARQKKLAEFTIQRLGLRDGEVVVRYRKEWFDLYCERHLTVEGLRKVAPLIAVAVDRDLANGIDWRK